MRNLVEKLDIPVQLLKKKEKFFKKSAKFDRFRSLIRSKNILLHDDFSKTQMFKNMWKSYGSFHDQNFLVIRDVNRLLALQRQVIRPTKLQEIHRLPPNSY